MPKIPGLPWQQSEIGMYRHKVKKQTEKSSAEKIARIENM